MIPRVTIDTAKTPDGGDLELVGHGTDLYIQLNGYELMGSRQHGTEDALGRLGCAGFAKRPGMRVLVGGLGLGYTTRAALDATAGDAEVVTAELCPDVARWYREHTKHLAKDPLSDPRAKLSMGDVFALIRGSIDAWDAILLDVDNGPEAFTIDGNDQIYDFAGIDACRAALREDGRLCVWSSDRDRRYEKRLSSRGFTVEHHAVRGHRGGGGHHSVYVARRARGKLPVHRQRAARR